MTRKCTYCERPATIYFYEKYAHDGSVNRFQVCSAHRNMFYARSTLPQFESPEDRELAILKESL